MPTINDAIVVASAYDTSGNGGRKFVKLDNGYLFSIMKDANTIRTFRSANNGVSWIQLGSITANTSLQDVAITTDGIRLYIVYNQTNTTVSYRAIDQNGITLFTGDIDSAQTALGNVSIITNETKTELHATWTSKNATYNNTFNPRHSKGIINADGSVTWGAVEQVMNVNSTGYDFYNPSVTVNHLNSPVILVEYGGSSNTSRSIYARNKNSGSWGGGFVHNGGSYAQSSPSAIFVPQSVNGLANGRIWVAWHGKDVTNASVNNVCFSYSDDGGATWSEITKLTTGNLYHKMNTSITANSNNDVFIVFQEQTSSGNYTIRQAKYLGGGWSFSSITSDTVSSQNPSALYDPSFEFTKPLVIYKTTTDIRFSGEWVTATISVEEGYIGERTLGEQTLTSLGLFTFDTGISTYVIGETYNISINSASYTTFDNAGVEVGDYITYQGINSEKLLTITAINGYNLTVLCNKNASDETPATWSNEEIIRVRYNGLLEYSITGAMSTITEKVNGVTVGTKTATSGETLTVGLTQEQWDEVAFGIYPYRNLLPPFTEWVLHANATAITDYELELNATSASQTSYYDLECNENTTYTFTHLANPVITDYASSAYLDFLDIDKVRISYSRLTGTNMTFTTPIGTEYIRVNLYTNRIGLTTFTKPMLNLGSTSKPFTPSGIYYNTLTIEMSGDTWTYTFDKRLGTDADILSVAKAVQDSANAYLPAVKSELASAIRYLDVEVSDTDSLEDMAYALYWVEIPYVPKYASGTSTASTSANTFQVSGGGSTGAYYITVSGLDFKPKRIIVSGTNTTYGNATTYSENLNTRGVTDGDIVSCGTSSSTYFRLVSPAYVNDTGFLIPVMGSGYTYNWEAFEE